MNFSFLTIFFAWSSNFICKILSWSWIFAIGNTLPFMIGIEILRTIPTYSRYKEKRRPNTHNPIFVYNKHQIWTINLMFVRKWKGYNDGIQFFFTLIESYSRKLFLIPMKNKTTDTTLSSFQAELIEIKEWNTICSLISTENNWIVIYLIRKTWQWEKMSWPQFKISHSFMTKSLENFCENKHV